MIRYMSLISFTEKGMDEIKDSVHRAGKFRQQIADAGGNVIGMYWSTGAFDGCVIFEAPDTKTGAALLVALGKQGYVRTQTMEIFDEAEFRDIAK